MFTYATNEHITTVTEAGIVVARLEEDAFGALLNKQTGDVYESIEDFDASLNSTMPEPGDADYDADLYSPATCDGYGNDF